MQLSLAIEGIEQLEAFRSKISADVEKDKDALRYLTFANEAIDDLEEYAAEREYDVIEVVLDYIADCVRLIRSLQNEGTILYWKTKLDVAERFLTEVI